MAKEKKRKREYFRKCGVCGRRFNQKDMIRDDCSDNGWICTDCHNDEYHDEEIGDFQRGGERVIATCKECIHIVFFKGNCANDVVKG